MKLMELLKSTNAKQTIELAVNKWHITATADALDYCLSNGIRESDVKSIGAKGNTLIVNTSCAEKTTEHYGCEGCCYEDNDYDQEPCKLCKYACINSNRDLYKSMWE